MLCCVQYPDKRTRTKDDHAIDRKSSRVCQEEQGEQQLSCALCLCCLLFFFFFFSAQHFCVGVASGPHLQFFLAAEFETKAKIYRSFHQALPR